MEIETINNISIFNEFNNYSSLLLLRNMDYAGYANNNYPSVSFSITNLNAFKRIKKASLFIRVLESSLNLNSYIGLQYYINTEEEYTDVVTINGDNYLFFDVTKLTKDHISNILFRFVNHSSSTLTLLATQSYVEIEYDEPYDYLDKQQFINLAVGKSFEVKEDILTLNTYISKPLFSGRFLFDYRLIYDYVDSTDEFLSFFPKGWKINLLEIIISSSSGYVLIDENYNKRLFKPTNDSSIFVDSTGTGLLLELQSGGTYKIFNPISSFYKEFDSDGRIVSCHTANNNSFSVSYTSTVIEITDSRNNVVIISKEDDVFTITSNTITQVYTLNIDESNLLQSISYTVYAATNSSALDSFEYSDSRISKITSFDDYNVTFNLELYKLTTTLKYKIAVIKTQFLEYKDTYVIHKDETTNVENRYYLDENKNIVIGGENTGIVNANDAITYFGSSYRFCSFNQTNRTHLQMCFYGGVTSHSIISKTYQNSYANTSVSTNYFEVQSHSKYIAVVKVNLDKRFPGRDDKSRGLLMHIGNASVVDTSNYLLSFDGYGEQYGLAVFNTGSLNLVHAVFGVKNNIGTFTISSIILIKIESKASLLYWSSSYITNLSTLTINSNSDTSIKYHLDTSTNIPMTMEDAVISKTISLKYGYPKYLFVNNLKQVYILDQSASDYLIIDNQLADFVQGTLVFANILAAGSNNTVYFEAFAFENNGSSSYIKRYVLKKNNTPYTATTTYDFDGNVLSSTDYRGVVTTNTYDSNKCLTSSQILDSGTSLFFSSDCTYDSNKRRISEQSLVGNQLSIQSKTYVSSLDLLSSVTDGESHTANYEYSSKYDYLNRMYVSIPPATLPGLPRIYSVKIEKDSKMRVTKYSDSMGNEYCFQYNISKDRVSKVLYQKNIMIAPFPFGGLNADEPNAHDYTDPFINPYHTETMFEITPTSVTLSDGTYKFPNAFQYCRVFDGRERFQYMDDWTVTDLHAYVSYNSPQDGGTISQIYDASGNEAETTYFSYTKGRVSQAIVNGYISLERNYDYDIFDRLSYKKELLTSCPISNNLKYRVRTYFDYNDIDDSVISVSNYIDYFPYGQETSNTIVSSFEENKFTDAFGRVTSLTSRMVGPAIVSVGFNHIYYHNLAGTNQTSHQISQVDYCDNNYIQYDYDKVGNITVIYGTGNKVSNVTYEYDGIYRLIKETNTSQGYYIEYTYDNSHNILSATKKTISNNTVISSDAFVYNQGDMTNRLKTFNDQTVTYDANSNITSINGATLTYYRGNKMSSYTKNSNTSSYKYSSNGLRVYKSSNGLIHRYVYDDRRLTREIIYNPSNPSSFHQFIFLYGISGLIGFTYDSTLYFYEKDILNNIIAIYRYDYIGSTLMNRYQYDAYGNTTVLDSNGNLDTNSGSIGNLNPFRYKSYYFDTESGYYYCQARYYAPFLRRWLSMDEVSYLSVKTLTGLNLFAYCNNNPVMNSDEEGHLTFIASLLIAAAIGFAVGTISGTATALYNDYKDDNIINGSIGPNGYLLPIFSQAISGAIFGTIGLLGESVLGAASTLTIGAKWLRFGVALSLGSIEGMSTYAFSHYNDFNLADFSSYSLLSPINAAFIFTTSGLIPKHNPIRNKYLRKIIETILINTTQDAFSSGFEWFLDEVCYG